MMQRKDESKRVGQKWDVRKQIYCRHYIQRQCDMDNKSEMMSALVSQTQSRLWNGLKAFKANMYYLAFR